MPKTPDEIKKGLKCCNRTFDACHDCPYDTCDEGWGCTVEKNADALALIQQLQAENAKKDETIQMLQDGNASLMRMIDEECEKTVKLEAERDAAVADIEGSQPCFACKNFRRNGGKCGGGRQCIALADIAERNGGSYRGPFWEWRGVQKEE